MDAHPAPVAIAARTQIGMAAQGVMLEGSAAPQMAAAMAPI